MKISPYKWFEVTIRYYNPAFPDGITTETIVLEAKNFSEAENRVRDLYKGFLPCEIQSINPTLYEDVLYADSFSEIMHWYLVEFEEDEQMLQQFYQSLKDEGCNCDYIGRCSHSTVSCKNKRIEVKYINESNYCDNDNCDEDTDYDSYFDSEYSCVSDGDSCQRCAYRDYLDYTHHGNIRTIDYRDTPTCFRFAGATANKAFILVQGRDFSHVLKRVKEYIYDSILDYNIFAIMQTHLCDVIPHDRCQL